MTIKLPSTNHLRHWTHRAQWCNQRQISSWQFRLFRVNSGTQMTFHHVYGHQDTRQRDTSLDHDTSSPSSISCSSFNFETMFDSPIEEHDPPNWDSSLQTPRLSRAAQMNIICDEIANDTAWHVAAVEGELPLTLQPPYPASKAMLHIGITWITYTITYSRQHTKVLSGITVDLRTIGLTQFWIAYCGRQLD